MTTSIVKAARGSLTLLGLCALSLLMPFLAFAAANGLPTFVVNNLFFLPQYVFPTVWKTNASPPASYSWWSVPVWLLLAAAFGFASRRWRFWIVFPVALAIFFAVIVFFQVAILASPFTFLLDGP